MSNNNQSTIQSRILSIKKLISNASLEQINPLKSMDQGLETEFFEGPKDIKDHKSLDSRTVLGKKTLNFYNIINRLNSKLIYIKSGAYGNTFKGIVTDDDENEVMSFAVKVVAFPKKDGYGSMYNVTRPENAEICMLKLLSYFVIKNQSPHLILPICTFNTSIKPFLKLQDEDFVPADNQKYADFVNNYNDGAYYETVSVVISEWANRGDLSMFLKKHYKKLELENKVNYNEYKGEDYYNFLIEEKKGFKLKNELINFKEKLKNEENNLDIFIKEQIIFFKNELLL